MKKLIVLVSCLALSTAACDKKKSDPAAKKAPAAGSGAGTAAPAPTPTPPPATGSAATPPPATGTPAAATDGIKITPPAPVAGEKVTEVETREMAMTIEAAPDKKVDMKGTQAKTELKEAVTVDGEVITKLKVSYSGMKETQTMGPKTGEKPSPVDGKTYLVWREGDTLKVSYEDGSAPSEAEVKEVTKGNRSVGRKDPLQQFVASVSWKVGEKVDLNADQLALMNQNMGGGEGEPSLTGMSFTLQSADDAQASLAMTMTMEMKGGGIEMKIDLTGVAKVDRKTNRLMEITGAGPINGQINGKVTGQMSMKTAYSYTPAS